MLALLCGELAALEGGQWGGRSVPASHALALALGRRPLLEPRADVDPSLRYARTMDDVLEMVLPDVLT